MASITISFPESGLLVDISVRNRATGSLDFSGIMENIPTLPDIWPTKLYTFEFTEVADTDYIFTATAPGWYEIDGTMYRDTASGWSGWWLTTEEHDHLMSLSQYSGWGIVDMTKNNKDLIDKINEFENLIKKIPFFDVKVLETLLTAKIGSIKPVDVSGIKTELSNLTIAITAQKSVLLDVKNKEKQEMLQELWELELEKQKILDKFDNFNENLKEKDSLLAKKQYDIDEKNKKISELEVQILQIEMEKESEKNKAEETINELLQLHKWEIEEKEMTEWLLVKAYIDK